MMLTTKRQSKAELSAEYAWPLKTRASNTAIEPNCVCLGNVTL